MTALSARDLVVTRGGRRLLDDVSVALRPGELVGIVGANGAGKSTLLRCLAGLLTPDSGSVALDGVALAVIPSARRARSIGFVPQRVDPAWDYSVGEILDMGVARGLPAPVDRAMTVAENELETLLDRRWSTLSGGERARTLLASVIVTGPTVLLADEPGASLDLRHRYDALARLRTFSRDRIVAVVLHELDLAFRFCDRLLVLDRGTIVLDASVATAADDPALESAFGVAFEQLRCSRPEAVPLPLLDDR